MPDDDGAPPEVPDGLDGAAADPGAPADPAAYEDGGGLPDVVADRLAGVEAAVAALGRRHDAEAERAAARERVIERQHADIERMRTDERFGALRPVLVELCRLRNDLLRQAATLPADLAVERMARLLESFAGSVEDTLLGCGVEVVARTVGDPFVPRRQQVARVVETDDLQRDGTIVEVVQDGYAELDGGRVVAPARVVVYRATATPSPAAETGSAENGSAHTPPAETGATDPNATKEHVDA